MGKETGTGLREDWDYERTGITRGPGAATSPTSQDCERIGTARGPGLREEWDYERIRITRGPGLGRGSPSVRRSTCLNPTPAVLSQSHSCRPVSVLRSCVLSGLLKPGGSRRLPVAPGARLGPGVLSQSHSCRPVSIPLLLRTPYGRSRPACCRHAVIPA